MAPRVTVLIVNYRVYDEVRQALRTLRAASADIAETVVFDQESRGAELAVLEGEHPSVRFVASARNLGFAAGVNRAAAAETSRAPYLLLLNPDALVEAPVLDTLASYLDAHPRVGLVGPRVLNDDGSVQASARRFPGVSTAIAGRSTWLSRQFPNNWLTRHNLVGRDARSPTPVDWLAGSCLMVRRDLFDRLGGLDEGFFMYWEDADFARRATSLGFSSVYLPEVTVRHAGGRSAAWNPASSIRAFHASAYRMYWKHSGAVGRLAAPIVKLALWLRGEIHARRKSRP